MAEATEKHLTKIRAHKRTMKEKIQKANDQRTDIERRARQLVPDAQEIARRQYEARKRAAERRLKASDDSASRQLRRTETEILEEKRKLSLDSEASESKIQTRVDQDGMKLKQQYLSETAQADRAKTQAYATAKQRASEAQFKLKEHEKLQRGDMKLQSEATRKQFEAKRRKLKRRAHEMIANLRRMEASSITDTKKMYKQAEHSSKTTRKKAEAMKEQAIRLSKEEISKAKLMERQADHDLGEIRKEKRSYQAGERKSKRQAARKLRKLQSSSSKKMKMVKNNVQNIKSTELEFEKNLYQKGNVHDEKFQKGQAKWLKRANKNALQNCDDAKKESILQTKAAHLSITRLARYVQDSAVHAHNLAEDALRKSKKLKIQKEKAAKNLEKVAAEAARQMACNKPDCTSQVSEVKKAAVRFASSKLPSDRAEQEYKEKDSESIKAKSRARERTLSWAQKKSMAEAQKYKTKADKICDEQQRWFQKVRHHVKKRMGRATEKEEKQVKKGVFQERRWALRKAKVLIGNEKHLTEQSVKAAIQSNHEAAMKQRTKEKAEKTATESKSTHVTNLRDKSRETRAKSKIKLKEALDAEDAKIKQADRLKDMAEKDYKAEQHTVHQRLRAQQAAFQAKQSISLGSLSKQKEKALKLLRMKRTGNREQLQKVRKKQRERKEKAQQKEDDEVETARRAADRQMQLEQQMAQRKIAQLQASLREAKSEAEQRLVRARLLSAQEHMEAKKVMAQALRGGPEMSQRAIEVAQKKAKTMIVNAKKRTLKLTHELRHKFEVDVQRETQKSLKDVKQIKSKLAQNIQNANPT